MVRGRTEREETGLVGGQTARRDCGSTWWSLRKRCGHVPTTYTPLLSAIYILAFSGIGASHVLSAVLPSTSTVRHGSHGQEGQESGPSREPQQRRQQRHRPAHQFPLPGQHISQHQLCADASGILVEQCARPAFQTEVKEEKYHKASEEHDRAIQMLCRLDAYRWPEGYGQNVIAQPEGIGVILTCVLPGTHQSSGHYASRATLSCCRALRPQHASGVRPLSTLQFLLSPLSPNHSPQLARTCCCLHVHVLQHHTAHSCPFGSGFR